VRASSRSLSSEDDTARPIGSTSMPHPNVLPIGLENLLHRPSYRLPHPQLPQAGGGLRGLRLVGEDFSFDTLIDARARPPIRIVPPDLPHQGARMGRRHVEPYFLARRRLVDPTATDAGPRPDGNARRRGRCGPRPPLLPPELPSPALFLPQSLQFSLIRSARRPMSVSTSSVPLNTLNST